MTSTPATRPIEVSLDWLVGRWTNRLLTKIPHQFELVWPMLKRQYNKIMTVHPFREFGIEWRCYQVVGSTHIITYEIFFHLTSLIECTIIIHV